MSISLAPTPISDKLNRIIDRLNALDLEGEAQAVDDVRRDCMAVERRSAEAIEAHYEVVNGLRREINDLKAAALKSRDTDDRAEESARKIFTILKTGKNFGELIYIDGVERFTHHQSSMSVLRPVFNVLKRHKAFRQKGHTLKFRGFTIYGRKP